MINNVTSTRSQQYANNLNVRSLIKAMLRDFPNTPGGELMCEWVYDFVKQHTQEELDHIMETGKFDVPSKFSPEANTKMIAEYEKNGAHHIES